MVEFVCLHWPVELYASILQRRGLHSLHGAVNLVMCGCSTNHTCVHTCSNCGCVAPPAAGCAVATGAPVRCLQAAQADSVGGG